MAGRIDGAGRQRVLYRAGDRSASEINTVLINMEFHIAHYDNEGFVTIEAYGDENIHALRAMKAQKVGENRYRLSVEKLGEFCDLRFGIKRSQKPPVSDEQRRARSENMRRAQAARWAKAES
jgi:hypothetical protein